MISKGILIMGILTSASCDTKQKTLDKGTFGYDASFLKQYQETIVLKNNNGKSLLAVVPNYQGRILTSSAQGEEGNSYGWLNYAAISSDKLEEKINIYGGEDRFWLGPEGGQNSIFFAPKQEFTFDNWKTPKEIDTEGFDIVSQTENSAVFKKEMNLKNYQGFDFFIEVKRAINLFDQKTVEKKLAVNLNAINVDFVGFESVNQIKNIGNSKWNKSSGLLSIWILGMLKPSSETAMFIPFKGATNYKSYFGDIPADKLSVKDQMILFKGDGTHRSKIGLPPENTIPMLGSYDAEKKVLTVVQFSFDNDQDYVNSMWEIQEAPYAGDVVNTYNDGPLKNGDQLGPFYELESSSPAKELAVQDSVVHHHVTYHFEGDEVELEKLTLQLFNKELKELQL
ncbi:hypothetical protein EI427_22325 [Flammeovirga pectinis]|uniref:DUF4380 domain-containing protein n=1 Tax=Flammeovirga pectinis TaxID=2494373 RepID=A0A3S9PC01_9BACT|nr:hypothetical protein EI427_22325 [Flammeovirga pectinis]